MNIIGQKIKQLREQQGLTQEQFVARLNVEGWDISRGTYAKIESQCRRVVDSEIPKLAVALNADINELFE